MLENFGIMVIRREAAQKLKKDLTNNGFHAFSQAVFSRRIKLANVSDVIEITQSTGTQCAMLSAKTTRHLNTSEPESALNRCRIN